MTKEYSKEELQKFMQVLKDFNDDLIAPSAAMIAFELEKPLQYVEDITGYAMANGWIGEC